MEHFIGSLLLPIFVIVVFASLMNIRPEAILMPLCTVAGAILKLVLDLVVTVVKMICGAAVVFIARLLNAR
jgi:hypothetical protein